MVIGAFPIAKLGLLAVRQVAKPIANVIKEKAKEIPAFRNYICMPPAQFYNWMEVKTKMWALNLGKPVTVPKLSEAMAIDLGANMLGEFIVFSIGAAVLIIEYTRQSSNEAKKQEALKQEKAELLQTITEMGFRIEQQDTQLRELTRAVAALESHSLFRWKMERLRDYQLFDREHADQRHYEKSSLDNKNPEGTSIYNPNGSLVMRALYFLDTEIFINTKSQKPVKYHDNPVGDDDKL